MESTLGSNKATRQTDFAKTAPVNYYSLLINCVCANHESISLNKSEVRNGAFCQALDTFLPGPQQ